MRVRIYALCIHIKLVNAVKLYKTAKNNFMYEINIKENKSFKRELLHDKETKFLSISIIVLQHIGFQQYFTEMVW